MSFIQSQELESMARAVMSVFTEIFEHLEEASIGYLMGDDEIVIKGSRKAAYAIIPTAMGQNRKIFNWALENVFGTLPDALIVAHADTWEELTSDQKVALVYHELRHICQRHSKEGEPMFSEEGQPVLEIVDHDVEEFLDVADTFGAWHDGLKAFQGALAGKANQTKINEVKKVWKQAAK